VHLVERLEEWSVCVLDPTFTSPNDLINFLVGLVESGIVTAAGDKANRDE
jgi:hypothetical protein